MKTKELKYCYELICKEYIRKFVRKSGLSFDGWVAGHIGGIAEFINQYFFSLDDITYDINNKLPKDMIMEWQDHCLENEININYYSYSKGLRAKDLNKSDDNRTEE